MSGLIPLGATLQFSNTTGDITHIGVLGSNGNNTPLLPNTFPTTSTGTSLGHYHYTEDTTNSLKFLNASGLGDGGHQFWHSSSTQAPVKVLETNRTETIVDTQFVVDKSTTSSPRVFSPNVFELSTNEKSVFFPSGTMLTQPPYNMTQLFNPIYMTQTTALYTTGDLAYAVLGDNESIQIFNNNNITNPIPPNVFPSDFGNSSNVGITLGIPCFALSPPSTTQTAILSDDLTITTDTDSSTLSATDLTFNGTSILPTPSTLDFTINTLPFSFPYVSTGQLTPQSSFSITITASSITLVTPISTDSMISAVLYRDNVFYPLSVSLTSSSIVLTGDFNGTQTIYFSGFIFF
jgi:hypothetical protein